MSPKRVRMSDIAAQVGNVSIATVSRALRDEPGVSPAVRERIRQVAEELSYAVLPESAGRVAVVTPVVETWFYSTVVAGIEAELRAAGLDLHLCCLPTAAERRDFYRRPGLRRRADGLIVVAAPIDPADRAHLTESGCPVISVGAHAEGQPSVGFNDTAAAEKAVAHLVHQGHTRIAMIRAESIDGTHWDSDLDRHAGYRSQLRKAHIPVTPDYEVSVPWGIDEGAQAMQRLLSLPHPPTAVFCHSDELAAGALRTLRHEAGLRVPESMSVIAIDNHPIADMINLTTVEQPARHQGALAARALLDHLHNRAPLPAKPEVLDADRIIFRSSTAAPNEAARTRRKIPPK
ncbi:LacI family DNA-binding transcriptional regulator [Nocardia sp. IFM 10818]